MTENLTLTFDVIQGDYVNGGKASSEIKKVLKELGLSQTLVRKIAVSSFEAEMNLVIHSLGGTINCQISENQIRLISKDKGPGIKDITKAMLPGFSTASDKAREMGFGAGMGLPNMQKNSDAFHIESSSRGTIIEMVYELGR